MRGPRAYLRERRGLMKELGLRGMIPFPGDLKMLRRFKAERELGTRILGRVRPREPKKDIDDIYGELYCGEGW